MCAGVACSSVVDCFSFNSFLLLAWPSPLVFKNLALARRVRRCFLLALPWLIASPLTLFFRWPGLPLWSFGFGAPAWAALPVIYVFVFRFARRNLKGDLEEGAWNKGERKASSEGCTTSNFKAQRTSRLMEKALPRFCQGIEFNCMTGRVSAEMEARILPGPFFGVYKSGWIKEKNHHDNGQLELRQNTEPPPKYGQPPPKYGQWPPKYGQWPPKYGQPTCEQQISMKFVKRIPNACVMRSFNITCPQYCHHK